MKRLSLLDALDTTPRAVALGFFDGVHLGHRAVLRHTLTAAEAYALTPAVFTFDTLPKLADSGLLLSREETDRRLEQLGFSERIAAPFSALHDLTPKAFAQNVLVDTLHAAVVCCGRNFRFGKNGEGDVSALEHWGQVFGFDVRVLDLVTADTEPISSTRIRRALAAGDMPTVNRLLGHPYEVTATVVSGAHLGRTLGTPTINQKLPPETVKPPFGVYASVVEVEGRVHHAVTNLGVKPTVGGCEPLAETCILDYNGDLYDRTVTVRPVRFLRAEKTFDSVESLRVQIQKDSETARACFAPTGHTRAVLFDFDDTLQNRREAFLNYARGFVRRHFPALPADTQELRAHDMAEFCASGNEFPNYDAFYTALIEHWQWQGAPPIERLVNEARCFFPNYTTLLPNVDQGLTALRARGYLLGIVTNGDIFIQNKKLDVSALRPLFDTVVIAGEEGVSKPDPEIFYRAAARLGVSPADCIFVGDHPEKDIEGAVSAGMQTRFMCACGWFDPPAGVTVVHSMDELIESI
ncbi:MAG: riboflavin biosynthesis protein RibF [Ruminococcaceae bacterium]|nr:riboflavin biosynthesis protein RibF [Oscillospiraceae bacterium]